MSLRIRMARGGTKKRPYYRIVIADSRTPRDGRFIERVGSYNPMVAKDHPDRIKLDALPYSEAAAARIRGPQRRPEHQQAPSGKEPRA